MFAIGGKKDQAKAAAQRSAHKPGYASSPYTPASSSKAGGYPAGPGGGTLSMYAEAPGAQVALEDFELFALDRMRVLKAIDDGVSSGKKVPEMEILIQQQADKHLKTTDPYTGAPADQAALAKDEVSHFALRLAYCRTEELRRWFLTQECALFRHRFRRLAGYAQAAFLAEHGLAYRPITPETFDGVKQGLHDVLRGQMRADTAADVMALGSGGFYAVPFEEVADLVRGRRVFIAGGQAYVPRDQLASLVVGAFRSRLSKALVVASRRWALHVAGEEKDRLTPVILSLSKRYLGRDYGKAGSEAGAADVITLKDLNGAAAQSFPLCAKSLFRTVKDKHHLKYHGRQQLQLFLKGIGLSLEDAMLFWKTEFCKSMPAEKFEKEHTYAIRHAYGKEGKRVDYTPHTCMKCISANPGPGEHHGCPYKTFGKEALSAALGGLKISARQVSDIVEKASGHHYQLACGMTFEAVHGAAIESGVQHPNQYFTESRKALGFGSGGDGSGSGSPEREPVTPGPLGSRLPLGGDSITPITARQ